MGEKLTRIEVELEDALVDEAMRAAGAVTIQDLAERALRALIRSTSPRKTDKKDLLDLVGEVNFYEGYDYKALLRTRYDAD